MVEVVVQEGDGRDQIGKFEFEFLPKRGDEITVPWADDPHGVRIFDVQEVCHTAAGVEGATPFTVLHVTEIT